MKEKFRYLDHTADVMIEAFGKTLEEAFSNAVLAVTGVMVDVNEVKKTTTHVIKVEANTTEKLFFDFIDEILFLLDVEHLLVSEVTDLQIKNNVLTCKVTGDHAINYDTHGDVKAPTYNENKFTIADDLVTIRFVVDI